MNFPVLDYEEIRLLYLVDIPMLDFFNIISPYLFLLLTFKSSEMHIIGISAQNYNFSLDTCWDFIQ